MSKTILASVDGYTPLIDNLVDAYGIMTAAVFGRVWRYCQMDNQICTASQETIAKELGISRQSAISHIKILITGGYLEEIKRNGKTSLLKDTGLAAIKIIVKAEITQPVDADQEVPVQNFDTPVQNIDTTCTNALQVPVQNFDTKRVFKKQPKKETKRQYSSVVFKSYEREIGILTPMIYDALEAAAEDYPEEWVVEAIEIAANQNKRSWAYIAGILRRWKAEGKKNGKKPDSGAPDIR